MQWPSFQDYNEAVRCPESSFEDADLAKGMVELDPLGLPKAASGNFATVYKLTCGDRRYAIKCFLRNVHGQHQRYAQLKQFTTTTDLPHMVDFEYQMKGICVDGEWFPIVKMHWVEGLRLDQFLLRNRGNKAQIERAIGQFIELMRELQRAGIAHGDLEHGNLMMLKNGITLVDYDGMFFPTMSETQSLEVGHPNYQHPGRGISHFGPDLDHFSAWIIYYSLLFLKLDPSLWQHFSGGDDCLLFRRSDFIDPKRSRLLVALCRHQIPDIREKFEHILALCTEPLNKVAKFSIESKELYPDCAL
jgi:hypothetical protein